MASIQSASDRLDNMFSALSGASQDILADPTYMTTWFSNARQIAQSIMPQAQQVANWYNGDKGVLQEFVPSGSGLSILAAFAGAPNQMNTELDTLEAQVDFALNPPIPNIVQQNN